MNVYRVEYFMDGAPSSVNRFVAAETMLEALSTVDPTYEQIMSAELIGGLMFAGGKETARAVAGGRQLTEAEIKATITEDGQHLVSLEDGKKYKSLKRHLSLAGLTPDQYRAKWGLPAAYPMVSVAYSIRRRDLALAAGLGKKGKKK